MSRFKKCSKTIVLLLFLAVGSLSAQVWQNKLPPATNSYYYKIAIGEGKTSTEATNRALTKLYYEVALANGFCVVADSLSSLIDSGNSFNINGTIGIPINKVCETVERRYTSSGYKVTILCQVAISANIKPNFRAFDCFWGVENKQDEIITIN